jgi:hypothetical protein
MVVEGFRTSTTNSTTSTITWKRLWRPPKHYIFDSYE